MNEKKFYICEHCGNIIEMVNDAGVPVMCCGQKMTLLEPGTVEASHEKHIPVVEIKDDLVTVAVGSVEHPMTEEHWIEWIELIADGISYKKFLNPGEAPVAEFCVKADKVTAREYCNLHGLWKAEA